MTTCWGWLQARGKATWHAVKWYMAGRVYARSFCGLSFVDGHNPHGRDLLGRNKVVEIGAERTGSTPRKDICAVCSNGAREYGVRVNARRRT